MNELKSLSAVADEVAGLVLDLDNLSKFRDSDRAWYDTYKKYTEKLQELKNKIFEDSEYQDLYAEKNKLCGKEQSVDFEICVWKEEYEDVLEKLRKRQIYLEKQYEQAKAEMKKTAGPDPIDWLLLPEFYPTLESAHVATAFGWVDEVSSFDEVLGPLARYVRLTIIYDKVLSDSTIKPISNGIWTENEFFIDIFWEKLQAGWKYSEKTRGIINENIKDVRRDLIAISKSKSEPPKPGPIDDEDSSIAANEQAAETKESQANSPIGPVTGSEESVTPEASQPATALSGGETVSKRIKEPEKEAAQAYKLYYGSGDNQTIVAEIMTVKLRKPVSQGQVSKWVNQYKRWAQANNIPIPPKPKIINLDHRKLEMRARTDGRISGDARHKGRCDDDE